jgi:hypothetical protein
MSLDVRIFQVPVIDALLRIQRSRLIIVDDLDYAGSGADR